MAGNRFAEGLAPLSEGFDLCCRSCPSLYEERAE